MFLFKCFQKFNLIFFSKNGGQLGSNARQSGNTLRISNIRPENSGIYICTASSSSGSDQVATVVDVERKYLIQFMSYFSFKNDFSNLQATDKSKGKILKNLKLF
jgi:hypothetical protein